VRLALSLAHGDITIQHCRLESEYILLLLLQFIPLLCSRSKQCSTFPLVLLILKLLSNEVGTLHVKSFLGGCAA
jgi:hypothetical protein